MFLKNYKTNLTALVAMAILSLATSQMQAVEPLKTTVETIETVVNNIQTVEPVIKAVEKAIEPQKIIASASAASGATGNPLNEIQKKKFIDMAKSFFSKKEVIIGLCVSAAIIATVATILFIKHYKKTHKKDEYIAEHPEKK